MFPWFFNVYIDVISERSENGNVDNGSDIFKVKERMEISWLVAYIWLDIMWWIIIMIWVMIGLVELCKRRGLNVNVNRWWCKEGRRDCCEVSVNGRQMWHASEFNYLKFMLDKLGTYWMECCKNVVNEWCYKCNQISCEC